MNEQNGLNIKFAIYYDDANNQRQSFHDIVLHKATYDNVIMSLGRNITGEFLWIDNKLQFSMKEYVIFNDVKYYIVNPPTVTHNGLVKDSSSEKGAAKYAVTFYHPEYTLGAISFNDVAVEQSEERYLSQNKSFSWIGNLTDFVAKLNANLDGTEWVCRIDSSVPNAKLTALSDVLTFDNNFISDALKTAYETYEVPFITSVLPQNDIDYPSGKRYLINFGLPSEEIKKQETIALNCNEASGISGVYYYREPIYVFNGDYVNVSPQTIGYEGIILDKNLNILAEHSYTATENTEIYIACGGGVSVVNYTKNGAYVFKFGKSLGLKNNSATPKNNKIITRIFGYGSERNIPYGYPQILWEGDQDWTDTKNNPNDPESYPIYEGIYGGQWRKLIKHPFTRTHLMPSIYTDCVSRKVNPLNDHYDPTTQIIDYYDAPSTYPNPINLNLPSCESHEFEDVYPRLWGDGEKQIIGAVPYDSNAGDNYLLLSEFDTFILALANDELRLKNPKEYNWLYYMKGFVDAGQTMDVTETIGTNPQSTLIQYTDNDNIWMSIKHSSPDINFEITVLQDDSVQIGWDDSIDDDGNYKQSYFKITLPPLGFDMYACANITEQMDINMRSGACIGCTFTIQCDWDDYKSVFYDENGKFVPYGQKRMARLNDYPISTSNSITVIVAKDIDTFGIIKPNIYQQPHAGDSFVILGISLPQTYIHNAEIELDDAMNEYMLENNVYYFDYPLSFDEKFLRDNLDVLLQLDNNKIVRFMYGNNILALYIKQLNIKFGESQLPQYSITLTDDVEIVLNQLGQTTEDVSKLRVQVSQIAQYYGMNSEEGYATLQKQLDEKLSKISNDVANGHITFQQGLTALGRIFFDGTVQSTNFIKGLESGVGKGWQIDDIGNGEMESLRIRSFLEVVELLINRVQAQEGDTLFTDNDQIDMVEVVIDDGQDSLYRLSLKEKWQGYVTSQEGGNILKGVINTLAGSQSGVSDVSGTASGQSQDGGGNKFYTSWMYVITEDEIGEIEQIYSVILPSLETNQIYVRCYHDIQTPTNKNFAPCEFMCITRWGCRDADSNVPLFSHDDNLWATVSRRQQLFYLSTLEGRIVKLVGVNNPILDNTNYGTTLGILPDFVKNYPSVQERIQANPNYDFLYAQGVVVEDFIKINYQGQPVINIVDKGTWTNTKTYLFESWDSEDLQYETHEVWYNGEKWRVLATNTNSIPSDNNPDWAKVLTKGADGTSINIRGSVGYVANDYSALSSITPTESFATGIAIQGTNANKIYGYSSLTGWTAFDTVDNGDGVIYSTDGHLYVWTQTRWNDCGQIKGDKGDDGADGNGISSIYNYYALSTQGSTTNDSTAPVIYGDWTTQQPVPTAQYPYLWQKTITYYSQTSPTTKYVLIASRGTDGVGKMGRNLYYAGVWVEKTVPDTFTVTDYQAPYFTYQNQNYVWVGANGNNIPINSDNRPDMQSGKWEIMVSDFKYLISQAIFSEFARLGEWLFNGDYMYSNDGKDLNGNETSYDDGGLYFGDGNANNTYIPNLIMNAQSGKMWARNIILQGVINSMIQEINSTSDFNGIGYYVYDSAGGTYYCNPLDVGTYIRCNLDQNRVKVMLPRAYTVAEPSAQGQAGQWQIDGVKENGQPFTLDEIRQCVGKKIIFMPGSCTWEFISSPSGLPLFLRSEHFKLLNFNTDYGDDLYEIQNAWGEQFVSESLLVAESDIGGHQTANLTYVTECKVGNYKGCECIYWEVTRSVKTLYQTY